MRSAMAHETLRASVRELVWSEYGMLENHLNIWASIRLRALETGKGLDSELSRR